MKNFISIPLFAAACAARPEVLPRAVGASCSTPDGVGICKTTASCKGMSIPGPLPGYCPDDPADIQCCVITTCSPPGQTGVCQNTNKPCGGAYNSGNFCPGDNSIQCCPTGGTSSGTTTGGSTGAGGACHPPGQTGICKSTSESCPAGFNSGNYCPGDNTIQCCPTIAASNPPPPPPPSQGPGESGTDACFHPAPNTCSFYPNCLESKYNCGPSGYPLGYGLNYCNKFSAANLSPNGRSWVTKTMLCLQEALVPYATTESTTCPALKDTAFGSHPHCYVSSGVCTLGPSDWLVIIETVSPKDLFGGVDNLKAVLETVGGCTEFYAWLIEQGILKVVDEVADAGKDIWHKLTDWIP